MAARSPRSNLGVANQWSRWWPKGRYFQVAGDGVLGGVASAVNAVLCAIDHQQGMAAANADELDQKHIVLRIAANVH